MFFARPLLILCCLAALPAFAQDAPAPDAAERWIAPPGLYALDPDTTLVTMTVARFLMPPVRATFGTVSGTLRVEENNAGELTVEIAANDLSANGPIVERWLKGTAFLNAAAYPEITFTADGLDVSASPIVVTGDLEMAGVSHPASFSVEIANGEQDPETNLQCLRYEAEGDLDRTDWDMSGYRTLVGDTVHIRIDANFIQFSDAAGASVSSETPDASPAD